MTIQITWHLIVMIVITVLLLIGIFREQESGLDLSAFVYGVVLVIIWMIYGGIIWW